MIFFVDMDSLIVDLDKVLDDFEVEGEGLKIFFLCYDYVVFLKILCLIFKKWNKINVKVKES